MSDSSYYDESATTATFLVEVDGEPVGRFIEAQGLEISVAVEEHEEGGENGFVHKLPGRMSWPNLVLKRGVTETNGLIDWVNQSSGSGFAGAENKLTRATMAISLVSSGGTVLRSWNFEGAFPVKWSGPNFAVSEDELAIEELEIAHHGFYTTHP
jgi:phage tail-like protein